MSQKKDKNSIEQCSNDLHSECCDDIDIKSDEGMKAEGKGLIGKAKDAGNVAIESAKDAGQAVADSAVGAKEYIVDKARKASSAIKEGAHSAMESLKSASEKPGEVIDGVKDWTQVKAQQAEGLLERIEGLLGKASEAIESLRDWSLEKAERLDRTLESAQTVVSRAEETLVEAHGWARDKASRMGDVLDKTKEAVERSTERLAAQTEELRLQGKQALERARQAGQEIKSELASNLENVKAELKGESLSLGSDELRTRIETARGSIRELEFKIRQLGVDPSGVRMYGTSNPDVQVLRDQIIEEEKTVTEYEDQLRRAGGQDFKGPQILPEKR